MRAARTDKGVHALGQVVSLKMVEVPGVDMVAEINAHLPPQIRVWGIKKTTKGFHGKIYFM